MALRRVLLMLTGGRSEKGQALVEMTLVLPLILVLIHLIVDFGMALDRRAVLQHSLREATRHAAEGKDFATISSVAITESDEHLAASDVTVCYIDEAGGPGSGDPGDVVQVHFEHEYQFVIGSGAFGIGPPTIHLDPTAEAVLLKGVPGALPC
jgi:TadE-like protein